MDFQLSSLTFNFYLYQFLYLVNFFSLYLHCFLLLHIILFSYCYFLQSLFLALLFFSSSYACNAALQILSFYTIDFIFIRREFRMCCAFCSAVFVSGAFCLSHCHGKLACKYALRDWALVVFCLSSEHCCLFHRILIYLLASYLSFS